MPLDPRVFSSLQPQLCLPECSLRCLKELCWCSRCPTHAGPERSFQTVIGDDSKELRGVRRHILCSGKVDLI